MIVKLYLTQLYSRRHIYFCEKKTMEKLVIIDNGHGADTPGKCSPDGNHREWEWCRKAAAALAQRLSDNGIASVLLVPENDDISLAERAQRANSMALGRNAVLVSLHNNAAGNGTAWHTANGWCAFVCRQAGADARRLATLLAAQAYSASLKGNRTIPPCGYLEANFAILRRTLCPAVLTENMFQDNRADVAFLASQQGFDTIINVHLNALTQYFYGE